MRTSILGLVVLSLASHAAAQAPSDEVSISEVLQLLRLGVSDAHVLDVVQRRGASGLASRLQLAEAGKLGAGKDLLDLLARRSARLTHIRELAKRFTRYDAKQAPFQMLVPVGWRMERRQGDGVTLLVFRPQDAAASNWMEAPSLFVYLLEGTPLPEGATAEVSARVAVLFARKVLRLEGTCAPRPTGMRFVGRKEVPEWNFRMQDRERRTSGTLVFRTRVWADGTLMIVGYGAGDGAEDAPRPLFEDFARGMTFRRSDSSSAKKTLAR